VVYLHIKSSISFIPIIFLYYGSLAADDVGSMAVAENMEEPQQSIRDKRNGNSQILT